MKSAKKSIACLIALALAWTSLPWASFAAQTARPIENTRPQARDIAALSPEIQRQPAADLNVLIGHFPGSLPETLSSLQEEKPVEFIARYAAQPGATPNIIAAGYTALANPATETRIIAHLARIGPAGQSDIGKRAARALSAVTRGYSTLAARSAAARAMANLHLDYPASFGVFFDGLGMPGVKELGTRDSSVVEAGFSGRASAAYRGGLTAYAPHTVGSREEAIAVRLKNSSAATPVKFPSSAGATTLNAIAAVAAAVAVGSIVAVIVMLFAGAAFPVLSMAAPFFPKWLGLSGVAGLVAFSVAAHEWAHGRAALHYGDPTALLAGRLTVNPLAHIDRQSRFGMWLPALGLALGGLALGRAKPVPLDPSLMEGGAESLAKVKLAGPLMSVALGLGLVAVALGMPLAGLGMLVPVLNSAAISNFLLAGFNLLPMGHLDGRQIFASWIRPIRMGFEIPAPVRMGAALAAAAAAAFISPVAAVFIMAGACVEQRRFEQEEAARRAIQEKQRRQEAYQKLRREFGLRAVEVQDRLIARNARVLVDTDLVTQAALTAVVKTLDDLWQRWKHEAPPQKGARAAFEEALQAHMRTALRSQGFVARSDALEALVAQELPQFAAIARKWQAEFSVAQSLEAEGKKAREEAVVAKEGVNIEREVQKEHQKAAVENEQGAAVKPHVTKALGMTALIVLAALGLFWPHSLVFGAAVLMLNTSEAPQATVNATAQASFDKFLSKAKVGGAQSLAKDVLADWTDLGPRPFAGRPKKVAAVMSILAQKDGQKKSVLLTGPSGVGKATLMSHIAAEIRAGTYALDMKVLELDLAKLSSLSSQMRAAPNAKAPLDGFFDSILPALKDKAIIVVKGIEGLVGPGSNSQFLDHLRFSLEHSGSRFVFFIENDAALPKDHFLRKYAKSVALEEPDEREAMQMLLAHKARWEDSYGMTIADEAIEELTHVSSEFLRRLNPLELIDNMEQALRVHGPQSRKAAASAAVNDLCSKLELTLGKYRRTSAVKDYNEVLALARALDVEQARFADAYPLTAQHVKEVMAEVYDNPQILRGQDFRQKILDAVPQLEKGVVGQSEAVRLLGNTLKRTAAGLAGHERPLGNFFFLGPTGVGKTETARVLARALFDDERAMIQLDMSEYMEKHTVARMIGAPPGYAGYEEGGQLTEAVRKRPYSVVLLDEIEKAHVDVQRMLLQILEDGRLTDGHGRTADFRRTIIIMTSNIASRLIQELQASGARPEEIRKAVEAELKKHLLPELIGRIGMKNVVAFNPLQEQQVLRIGKLLVQKEIARPLVQRGHELVRMDRKVIRHIARRGGYAPEYGARPMRDEINTQVGDPLAEHLNSQKGNRKISVRMEGGEIHVSSEPLLREAPAKDALPKGRLGVWTRHILDPDTQLDVSAASLKASYDTFAKPELPSQSWGTFSLQAPAPAGEVRFELKSSARDPGVMDPALDADDAPGGGLFGWIERLRQEGYADKELAQIQSWMAKALRCGKSAAAGRATNSRLKFVWLESDHGHVFKVTGPALNKEELSEAYVSYAAHFSKQSTSLDESWKAADALAEEGHRSRALLLELKRGLSKIAGAHFGAYWDKDASSYWLLISNKENPTHLDGQRSLPLAQRTQRPRLRKSQVESYLPQLYGGRGYHRRSH